MERLHTVPVPHTDVPQIDHRDTISTHDSPEMTEENAEDMLDDLLSDPSNAFLTEVPQNKHAIETAENVFAALRFAQERIALRRERTFQLVDLGHNEGIALTAHYEGLKRTSEHILHNMQEIDRGGDAMVVLDTTETEYLPEEMCYKVEFESKIHRGRNSLSQETRIHDEFYTCLAADPTCKIGVPKPYYELEMGGKNMLAMERLHAARVDWFLTGRATLPEWFDVDECIAELTSALDTLHKNGLFHRDLHMGNFMISTAKERPEKIAYIIDFGVSITHGTEGGLDNPYVSEVAGNTFTFTNDYGIVNVLKDLYQLKKGSV